MLKLLRLLGDPGGSGASEIGDVATSEKDVEETAGVFRARNSSLVNVPTNLGTRRIKYSSWYQKGSVARTAAPAGMRSTEPASLAAANATAWSAATTSSTATSVPSAAMAFKV